MTAHPATRSRRAAVLGHDDALDHHLASDLDDAGIPVCLVDLHRLGEDDALRRRLADFAPSDLVIRSPRPATAGGALETLLLQLDRAAGDGGPTVVCTVEATSPAAVADEVHWLHEVAPWHGGYRTRLVEHAPLAAAFRDCRGTWQVLEDTSAPAGTEDTPARVSSAVVGALRHPAAGLLHRRTSAPLPDPWS